MTTEFEGDRVLVTGAGGFIGSHLVEELVRQGADVRALVRYNSRADLGNLKLADPEVVRDIDVRFGDLRDPDTVRDVVDGVDVVFHLGALIAIPYSYLHPREVAETNVMGTLNVLESSRCARARRVVHVSTSEVYGTARVVPISEAHPLQGQSPYSASKIGADRLAEAYHRSFGLPVVTVRPFNTFGPRQSARAVIPTIITQVLTRDELRLGSVTPRRDFTYVSDTVAGMLAGGSAHDVEGLEVNLGTGRDISVGELATTIMKLVGREIPVAIDDTRIRPEKSEVERLLADNSLARDRLDWQPTTTIEEGLERTIEWVRRHLELYRPDVYEV
jgi:dTDP-glucose 4,6-dehydratase